MQAHLIDGKALAERIKQSVKARSAAFAARHGRLPRLQAVLVGDDSVSASYVSTKEKAGAKCGIAVQTSRLPKSAASEQIIAEIERLNSDSTVDGIIVQLPLPGIEVRAVIDAIDPRKDVDGLTSVMQARLLSGHPGFVPCTPAGCLKLIAAGCELLGQGNDLRGLHAAVIGRSALVGRAMAMMLLRDHCTVSICHSHTKNLKEICMSADIVIAAAGSPGLITGTMLKPGCIVIDVGINRLADGRIVGDVDTDSASAVAGAITPVPGGVGPMTVAMLLENVISAAEILQL